MNSTSAAAWTAAIVVGFAQPQVGAVGRPTIESLANRIDLLEARVVALEGRQSAGPGASISVPSPSPCGQACKVISIAMVEPDPDLVKAAQKAEDDAAKAEADADAAARSSDKNKRSDAGRLASKARSARLEAARLRRQADMPRQRIVGWNGVRPVTLTSEDDLSPLIARISVGQYIAWVGTATRIDAEGEEWSIVRFERVDRPRGYSDPRTGPGP